MKKKTKIRTDISKPLIERLASISENRLLADTPCDCIFTDVELGVIVTGWRDEKIVDDPIKAALDYTAANHDKTAIAVAGAHFMIVEWGPNWMHALKLWDEWARRRERKTVLGVKC